jgi:hypothetical protein
MPCCERLPPADRLTSQGMLLRRPSCFQIIAMRYRGHTDSRISSLPAQYYTVIPGQYGIFICYFCIQGTNPSQFRESCEPASADRSFSTEYICASRAFLARTGALLLESGHRAPDRGSSGIGFELSYTMSRDWLRIAPGPSRRGNWLRFVLRRSLQLTRAITLRLGGMA